MKNIFQSYQKKLTNLSSTNRSLFLPRLSALNDIDLHSTDFLENKPSFTHITSLIEGKSKLTICKVNDSRSEANTLVSNRLRAIQRRSNYITEERGVHDLYIGWPFVNGIFNDGTTTRCPLLLWPVKIEQEQGDWKLIQTESGMVLNKSFLLAYSHFNTHKINEELVEEFEANYEPDPLAFRTQLYELLKSLSIDIQFNRDLFLDKLSFFQEYKRADFDLLFKQGELKLMPEAVLGIFPSFGSYLAPDYDFLIDNFEGDNLENFFSTRTNTVDNTLENYIHSVKEEQVITPFSIDIFQENILKSVKKGLSVVVQGPPGTGKSQLIANLTADYIARGKKVLVVCEKRVALDVIYQRFKQIGVDDFIALVHDNQLDRGSLYQKMAHLIEGFDEHKRNTQTIDALRIEQQFVEISRRIEQITGELDEFRDNWYNDKDYGISISELFKIVNYDFPFVNVNNYIKFIDYQNINAFKQKLNQFNFYISKLPKSAFWDHRLSLSNKTNTYKSELLNNISSLKSDYQSIIDNVGFKLDALTQTDLLAFENHFNFLNHLQSIVNDDFQYQLFNDISIFKKDLQLLIKSQKKVSDKIGAKCFINNTLLDIDTVLVKVNNAIEQCQSTFGKLRYQLFNADYKIVKSILINNQLTYSLDDLCSLQMLIKSQIENISICKEINKIKGAQNLVFENYDSDNIVLVINNLIKLIEAKTSFKDLNLPEALLGNSVESLHSNIETLKTAVSNWKQKLNKYHNYFSAFQIDYLLSENEHNRLKVREDLENYFDTYEAFDTLLLSMQTYEIEICKLLISNNDNGLNINDLLLNSFAIAWKESLQEKYPNVRLYQSDKFELLSNELNVLIDDKITLSKQLVQIRLQENVHKHVEYNRLSNRVTYRDLIHQVTKRKKIWPIRKLISSLSDDIFKILPCWLASPETVSAMFPMEQYFDLVIFDEASQCFAERGIPAIFRAKQIVVTGDSQQLSPNDLYKVRWIEEDEDDTPELAYDSLLDLCGRYFKSLMLKQHYRSNDPALISFSNEHFYRNSLIFSNKINENESVKAIEFKYIQNAVWKNRSNQLEAQEVIHLLAQIQRYYPMKSVGIITFNYHQQELIYSILQESIASNYLKQDERLIVKNIENIQGDERDIIIFSVGYAPDDKGKLQMNFGSLSLESGEKRLNVAITRAKDKIYIVSSILPENLMVENTLHEGPKLFKKYLELAKNNTFSTKATTRNYEWSECLSMKFHVRR